MCMLQIAELKELTVKWKGATNTALEMIQKHCAEAGIEFEMEMVARVENEE